MSTLLPEAIASIYAATAASRSLTVTDYQGLQEAQSHLMELGEEERYCVTRMVRWVHQGRLVLTPGK
jgi:hypothetical protein